MMDIEDMWDVLLDLDLTQFVDANLTTWRAKRSQAVFLADGPEEVIGPDAQIQRVWRIFARRLCLDASPLRVFVSSDGRTLRGRSDSAPARWDDLVPALGAYAVAGVRLDGLSRRLTVAAENDADVYRDVTTIRTNINDEFHVPVVEVRAPHDGAALLRADFTTMIVDAVAGKAPLGELVGVALTVLGYRYAQPPARPHGPGGEA